MRINPKREYPEVVVATVDYSDNLVTAWDGAALQDQIVITRETTTLYEAYGLAFTYNP